MRKTLIETNSIRDAGAELTRLEALFYDEFNKNSDISFYLFGTSSSNGITMEYDAKFENQAKWFESQVNQNK